MPVVRIYGLTLKPGVQYSELRALVIRTVYTVPELHLKPGQVTVFMPVDLCEGVQDDVVITVDLMDREPRTEDVLRRLSNKMVQIVDDWLTARDIVPSIVEAWCVPINEQKQGYDYVQH